MFKATRFLAVAAMITWVTVTWYTLPAAAEDQPKADQPKTDRLDPAALFDQLDANKDGQVTSDEVPDDKKRLLARLLRMADKDHDGKLTREEFVAGLKDQQPERPLEQAGGRNSGGAGAGRPELPNVDQMFKRLDRNGDGKITLDEVPPQARDRIEQLMARADKNGDGALTKEEVEESFKKMRETLAGLGGKPEGRPDPMQLFKRLDKNGDGKVTLDELPDERRPMFEKIMQHADKDGDKALSQEEFIAGMRALAERLGRGKPDQPGDQPPSAGEKPKPGKAGKKAAKAGGKFDPAKVAENLMKMDANKDGKISREEFSAPQKDRFGKFDINGDGFIDAAEVKQRVEKMAEKKGQIEKRGQQRKNKAAKGLPESSS